MSNLGLEILSRPNQVLKLIQSGVNTKNEISSYFTDEERNSITDLLYLLCKKNLVIRDISTRIYTLTQFGIWKLEGAEENGQRELEKDSRRSLYENSPFELVLKEWLAESNNLDRWVSASELNTALKEIAEQLQLYWYWKNGSGFGMHLSALASQLNKEFGLKIQEGTSRIGKRYKFTRSQL